MLWLLLGRLVIDSRLRLLLASEERSVYIDMSIMEGGVVTMFAIAGEHNEETTATAAGNTSHNEGQDHHTNGSQRDDQSLSYFAPSTLLTGDGQLIRLLSREGVSGIGQDTDVHRSTAVGRFQSGKASFKTESYL